MTSRITHILALVMALAFSIQSVYGAVGGRHQGVKDAPPKSLYSELRGVAGDSISNTRAVRGDSAMSQPEQHQVRESIFKSDLPLSESHFTWGAEVGSSIDLGGHDMSTFDLDVLIGYKSAILRTLGIGAGIHRSFGTNNNFYPLYVVFRSSFRSRPSLFFLDLRAGYSFYKLRDRATTGGGVTASIGLGVNLSMSKRFKSHITISAGYFSIDGNTRAEINLAGKYVCFAKLGFGVNF